MLPSEKPLSPPTKFWYHFRWLGFLYAVLRVQLGPEQSAASSRVFQYLRRVDLIEIALSHPSRGRILVGGSGAKHL